MKTFPVDGVVFGQQYAQMLPLIDISFILRFANPF